MDAVVVIASWALESWLHVNKMFHGRGKTWYLFATGSSSYRPVDGVEAKERTRWALLCCTSR